MVPRETIYKGATRPAMRFGIPLVPFKVFRVSDGSAEMLVISDDNRIPSKNARVRVRGEVQEFALIGGRSFGLHLREKSIKYL